MRSATLPNTPANTASGARAARRLPPSAAMNIGMAQRLASSESTAPRAWCVRAELIDVGMMAASEVATATCMRYSSGTPAKRSENSSTGTVTMPPPTPSRPAANPAMTPDAARMAKSGRRSDKCAHHHFAEGTACVPGERRMHLADDGQRDGFGRAATDIEPDGRAQAALQPGGVATEILEQMFTPRGRPQQSDVRHAAR